MSNPVLSTIGLSLDIVGVTLLYFFGFGGPTNPSHKGVLIWRPGNTERDQRIAKRARYLAPLGLALLLFGFALQIIAQWYPVNFIQPASEIARTLPYVR